MLGISARLEGLKMSVLKKLTLPLCKNVNVNIQEEITELCVSCLLNASSMKQRQTLERLFFRVAPQDYRSWCDLKSSLVCLKHTQKEVSSSSANESPPPHES